MRRDDDTKAPQVIFGGANAMVQLKFDEIYFDTRIDEERWYWYTLPYDGQVKEVSYSNNAANGKSPIYFTDFWVKYYNGLLRAQDVNGSALADTYWQHVASADRDYTMQAGQGYIVGIANQKNVTQPDLRKHTKRVMRFTMRPNDLTWNAMEKNSSKVTLVEPSTCNESRYAVHAGWNLVGNPYLHNYGTGASGGSGLRNGAWTKEMDGELWTGFWILDESRDTDVPYVTIYTPNPERPSTGTYSQDFVAGRTIKPLEAVFVQINEGTQINFANANMNVASMPAYKRFMQPQGPVRTGVELTGLGYSDYTGVVLSDEYTTQYEIGADLVKYSNAGKLNLYTLNADNQQLAFNGLSEEDAVAPIPVGATIPATGEYTFAFDAERYNMSLVDTVMLIDYTEGTQTNLLYNNYTFTAEKGKNEGRFALLIRLAKEPQIVTNLDETYDADKPRKIIRDGILYIIRDDKMYNALGAEVK